jgi:hypothetical protein
MPKVGDMPRVRLALFRSYDYKPSMPVAIAPVWGEKFYCIRGTRARASGTIHGEARGITWWF